MALIIGIDPGLQKTGWGIVEHHNNNIKYVSCGTIYSDSKDAIPARLNSLSKSMREIIDAYKPHICSIEETFVNKNPASSLKLGHARGALLLTIAQAEIEVHEYAATLIKKTVVGIGRAEKAQVKMMVQQILPKAQINSEDSADALAAAICHINHQF